MLTNHEHLSTINTKGVLFLSVLINKLTLSETPLLLHGAGSSAQSVISKHCNQIILDFKYVLKTSRLINIIFQICP